MKKILSSMLALLLSIGFLAGCSDGFPEYSTHEISNDDGLRYTTVGIDIDLNGDEKETKELIFEVAKKEAEKILKENSSCKSIRISIHYLEADEEWDNIYDNDRLGKRLAYIAYDNEDGFLQEIFDYREYNSENFEWFKSNL